MYATLGVCMLANRHVGFGERASRSYFNITCGVDAIKNLLGNRVGIPDNNMFVQYGQYLQEVMSFKN